MIKSFIDGNEKSNKPGIKGDLCGDWQAITGDGGSSERDGVSWMLAYWVGRYYELIN